MSSEGFSIIIPTLNSSKTIKRTLNSILKQTYKKYEVIIIDGGSKDNTRYVIKSFFKNSKFVIFKKKKGLAAARYHGIKIAKYSNIAFLDSDDTWDPNKLYYHSILLKNPRIKFQCTSYRIITFDQKISHSFIVNYNYVNLKNLIYDRPISNSSVIINKFIALKIFKNFQVKSYAEDYIWWIELLKKNYNCKVLSKNLTNLYLHDKNRSRDFLKNIYSLIRIYKQNLKFNNLKILLIFIYLVKNNFKKLKIRFFSK